MRTFTAVAFAALLAADFTAQRPQPAPTSVDLVELDLVALDRNGQPVTDLNREEVTIREDGRKVELQAFSKVTALGSTRPDDARILVLLMDDIGVAVDGTSPMQQIAPVVLAPFGQGDELSVVRLASRSDEAFGDLMTARDRISGYRGGAVPFSRRDTPETVLKAITKISRQLDSIDHKRKVILCLGLPAVCDVAEPPSSAPRETWQAWTTALGAAAHANVSLYVVDPTGSHGGSSVTSNGLVQLTGGRVFAHENNFAPAGEAIWREAGHYYLATYWPAPSKHDLHTIDVSVSRKGVQIHARQRR
jgi:VWFA-related protein